MLSILKNIFGRKKSQQKSVATNSLQDHNAITFLVDKDNNMYIYVSAIELSDTDAKNFANMLHGICGGQYTQDILNILLNLGKEDVHIDQFVNRIVDHWVVSCALSPESNPKLSDSEPLIKPTIFFKNFMNNRND